MSSAKAQEKEEVPFVEKKFIVTSRLGLHARPAALFVQLAKQFRSEVVVRRGRIKANGKSIMDILTLAAGPGCQVLIQIRGDDAKKAMSELQRLFATRFGE